MKQLAVLAAVFLGTFAPALLAHPHFQKRTSAKLPGDVEVSVSFFTVSSNMSHANETATGDFVAPGLPALEISADLKAGSISIPKGTYTVGAIKNGTEDWIMALHPGKLGFNDTPDKSELIKLDSSFRKSSAAVDHLVVDITPCHGKSEGKAIIVLGFGSLSLESVLSDGQ